MEQFRVKKLVVTDELKVKSENWLKLQFNSRTEAEAYAEANLDSVEKYYCKAVRFSDNGKNGFVFYGWAAC